MLNVFHSMFRSEKIGFSFIHSMLTAEPPVGKNCFHKFRLALAPFIRASLKVISINSVLLRFAGERPA